MYMMPLRDSSASTTRQPLEDLPKVPLTVISTGLHQVRCSGIGHRCIREEYRRAATSSATLATFKDFLFYLKTRDRKDIWFLQRQQCPEHMQHSYLFPLKRMVDIKQIYDYDVKITLPAHLLVRLILSYIKVRKPAQDDLSVSNRPLDVLTSFCFCLLL